MLLWLRGSPDRGQCLLAEGRIELPTYGFSSVVPSPIQIENYAHFCKSLAESAVFRHLVAEGRIELPTYGL